MRKGILSNGSMPSIYVYQIDYTCLESEGDEKLVCIGYAYLYVSRDTELARIIHLWDCFLCKCKKTKPVIPHVALRVSIKRDNRTYFSKSNLVNISEMSNKG